MSLNFQVNEHYSAEKHAQLSNLFSLFESLRYVCHDDLALRKNICTNEIQLSKDEIFIT